MLDLVARKASRKILFICDRICLSNKRTSKAGNSTFKRSFSGKPNALRMDRNCKISKACY